MPWHRGQVLRRRGPLEARWAWGDPTPGTSVLPASAVRQDAASELKTRPKPRSKHGQGHGSCRGILPAAQRVWRSKGRQVERQRKQQPEQPGEKRRACESVLQGLHLPRAAAPAAAVPSSLLYVIPLLIGVPLCLAHPSSPLALLCRAGCVVSLGANGTETPAETG